MPSLYRMKVKISENFESNKSSSSSENIGAILCLNSTVQTSLFLSPSWLGLCRNTQAAGFTTISYGYSSLRAKTSNDIGKIMMYIQYYLSNYFVGHS